MRPLVKSSIAARYAALATTSCRCCQTGGDSFRLQPLKHRADKSKTSKPPQPPAPAPSPRRLWLFRFLALLSPLLLLALAELVLRLIGAGYSTSFFKEFRAGGREFLENNNTFSLRFFPPELARWPTSFRFEHSKPPDACRIFIFGESAAMGDPQPAFGPGRFLEVLLRNRFPARKFEVINLGITAINSHVILPIARECSQQNGDVWVIYMGNNEMVGPFGAATAFGSRAPPFMAARLNLAVQRPRLGQVFRAFVRKLGGKPVNPSWGGMEM